MWIVRRRIPVLRDGKRVILGPGDPVPEAETWKNRGFLEHSKRIAWVPGAATVALIEESEDTVVESVPSEESSDSTSIEDELFAPAKRKRGRPRKNSLTESEDVK